VQESLVMALADRFDELGLRFAEPIDLADLPDKEVVEATLVHASGRERYSVAYSASLTMSALEWARGPYVSSDRLLLLGPRVTERSAEMFRALEINYLDQAGNAFIAFDGVHIDVRGRRATGAPPRGDSAARATRGGVNLFSPKRSQVVFALLSWDELLDAPLRQIAQVAGVSLGQAQETVELLMQYGYLDEQRRFLRGVREHLIDQWTAAFPAGLGSSGKTSRFSGDFADLVAGDTVVYISGEAAVPSTLRPETLVLYSDEFPTKLIRARGWHRDDDTPNIFLRHQFWHPADPADVGVRTAPWLLVYADLMASRDSRQREVAQQIRKNDDRARER